MKEFDEKKAREELLKRAEKVKEEDISKVLDRSKDIDTKLQNASLQKFIEQVKLFLSLLRDYRAGKYKQIPFWSIAAIVAALLYLLSPLDLIPDFIPGIGYIDDLAILQICWTMVRQDLDAYKTWLSAT